jgi:uncharacterized protein YqeY
MFNSSSQTLVNRLRTDLLEARKAGDQLTTATLQTVISAIDNAGAIPAPESISSVGVGSTEAPRRELSAQDAREIVEREITELQHAIKESGGMKSAYADELSNRITILEKYR